VKFRTTTAYVLPLCEGRFFSAQSLNIVIAAARLYRVAKQDGFYVIVPG